MSEYTLAQVKDKNGGYMSQGQEMKKEINERYLKLFSDGLIKKENNISDIVSKYFRIGMKFSEAELILIDSGLSMEKRPIRNTMGLMDAASIVASGIISSSAFSKVGIQIVLTPDEPGLLDNNRIGGINAIIFSNNL